MINSMSGFSTNRYSYGVLKDVDEKKLQEWMANPSRYKDELQRYAMYQYITQGDIFTGAAAAAAGAGAAAGAAAAG